MTRLRWGAFLALLLLAQPALGVGFGNPYPVNATFNFQVNIDSYNCQFWSQVAPWYLYFPEDPNCHSPSYTGHFPYWPQQGQFGAPAAAPGPIAQYPGQANPYFRPVHYQPQV